MKQIISEYGTAITAMICVLAMVSLVGAFVFGGPVTEAVTEFANSICGGNS